MCYYIWRIIHITSNWVLFNKNFYTSYTFRDNTIKLFIVRQVFTSNYIYIYIYIYNNNLCIMQIVLLTVLLYYFFYCIIYIIKYALYVVVNNFSYSFHNTDYFTNDSSINLKILLLLNINAHVYVLKENIVSHHYVII